MREVEQKREKERKDHKYAIVNKFQAAICTLLEQMLFFRVKISATKKYTFLVIHTKILEIDTSIIIKHNVAATIPYIAIVS